MDIANKSLLSVCAFYENARIANKSLWSGCVYSENASIAALKLGQCWIRLTNYKQWPVKFGAAQPSHLPVKEERPILSSGLVARSGTKILTHRTSHWVTAEKSGKPTFYAFAQWHSNSCSSVRLAYITWPQPAMHLKNCTTVITPISGCSYLHLRIRKSLKIYENQKSF